MVKYLQRVPLDVSIIIIWRYLHQDAGKTQALARTDGKLFYKKIVMGKAGIPPSISEETVRKVVQKTDLKWTNFQRKGILTENDLKLRLKFARKVCRKHAMCNYGI